RSTVITSILLIYLGVMSYIGYSEFQQGNYLYYFGVIGVTLFIIVILHIFLKKRERLQENDSRRA
ncbi:MAG: hypothetical protein K2G72_02940, partial [Duncaniella sp.]|nr:hypothetical protein [Duncaniella sp.]